VSGDKGRAGARIRRLCLSDQIIPTAAEAKSAHVGRPRQQLADLDRDAVAVDHHRALGDRRIVGEDIVGEDIDGIVFLRVQLDNGGAAEREHLMDRHGGGAQHHGDVDGSLFECGYVVFLLRAARFADEFQVTMVWCTGG
jgi:hypothetical protein